MKKLFKDLEITNFFKGIFVGIGGIAPGLSGSVLLVIFGLYEKTINAIGTIFKNFKKNIIFLIPLFFGVGIGILLFSKLVKFLLGTFEMQTRFAFLGLIIGTIPLFYKEVKKEGFSKKYYIYFAIALVIGIGLFYNGHLFSQIENPNILQSIIMGICVAGSSIVPGIDSAAILSALGLYNVWVNSVATLNIPVLIPAAVGVGVGALAISFCMNKLLKKCYTATFSVIFGFFIAIIPTVLKAENGLYLTLELNLASIISVLLVPVGFAISYFFGNLNKNSKIIKFFSSFKTKLPKNKKNA